VGRDMKSFRIVFGLLAAVGVLAVCVPAALPAAGGKQAGTVTGGGFLHCPPGSMNRMSVVLDLASTGKDDGSGTGLVDASCQVPSFSVPVTFSCVTITGVEPAEQVVYASGVDDAGRFYVLKVISPANDGPDEYGVEVSQTPFNGMNGTHCGAKNVLTAPFDGVIVITTTG
jgi:hypothetical protein